MREKLKAVGYTAIWPVAFIGLIILAALFIKGGIWISDKIYPWLVPISAVAIFISFFVCCQLLFLKNPEDSLGPDYSLLHMYLEQPFGYGHCF